jgi:hypothetical protein
MQNVQVEKYVSLYRKVARRMVVRSRNREDSRFLRNVGTRSHTTNYHYPEEHTFNNHYHESLKM